MSSKSVEPHLVIIRESLRAIDSYRPENRETFLQSPALQDAILMRLQVIEEQVARLRRLDENWFAGIADPSWFQVIGLRNVIAHGYETIEPDIIWKILSDDLILFKASLARLEPTS